MATKVIDGREVEVQTQVVLVSLLTGVAVEGLVKIPLVLPNGYYLKVVTEWVCPDCKQVHGDQFDFDGPCD